MATPSESLLDDATFVARLDDLDVPLPVNPRPAREPHWFYEEAPAVKAPATRAAPSALGVIGFTLMAALGGIGAALVLHDHLAQLLW